MATTCIWVVCRRSDKGDLQPILDYGVFVTELACWNRISKLNDGMLWAKPVPIEP